jgi:hypothetical protein
MTLLSKKSTISEFLDIGKIENRAGAIANGNISQ